MANHSSPKRGNSSSKRSTPHLTISTTPDPNVDRRISTPAGQRLSMVLRKARPANAHTPTSTKDATSSFNFSFSSLNLGGSLSGSEPNRTPIHKSSPFFSPPNPNTAPSSPHTSPSPDETTLLSARANLDSTIHIVESSKASREASKEDLTYPPVAHIPFESKEGPDITVWSDIGSMRMKYTLRERIQHRWDRTSTRKKGIFYILLVLILLIIAAAIGLGLGLGLKKKDNGSKDVQEATDGGSNEPNGHDGSNEADGQKGPSEQDSADKKPKEESETVDITGKHSYVVFLDTSQTSCVGNANMWSCPPNHEFNSSPEKAYAVFDWEITKKDNDYKISAISSSSSSGTSSSANSPAFGAEFYNQPLELVGEGTSEERYIFQVKFDKVVTTTGPISIASSSRVRRLLEARQDGSGRSISSATCVFPQATLRGSIYTSAARTYPTDNMRPIPKSNLPYDQWPHVVEIEEIVAAQSALTADLVDTVPTCYTDSERKNPIKLKKGEVVIQAADQPAALCSCLYNSRK